MSAIFSDETAVEHIQRVKPRAVRSNALELLDERNPDPETGSYRKISKFELLKDVCGAGPIWLWPFPCLRHRRVRNFNWSMDALGFRGGNATVGEGPNTDIHSYGNGSIDTCANVPLLSAIHDGIEDMDTTTTILSKISTTRGVSATGELWWMVIDDPFYFLYLCVFLHLLLLFYFLLLPTMCTADTLIVIYFNPPVKLQKQVVLVKTPQIV